MQDYVVTIHNIGSIEQQISTSHITRAKLIHAQTGVKPKSSSLHTKDTKDPYLWLSLSSQADVETLLKHKWEFLTPVQDRTIRLDRAERGNWPLYLSKIDSSVSKIDIESALASHDIQLARNYRFRQFKRNLSHNYAAIVSTATESDYRRALAQRNFLDAEGDYVLFEASACRTRSSAYERFPDLLDRKAADPPKPRPQLRQQPSDPNKSDDRPKHESPPQHAPKQQPELLQQPELPQQHESPQRHEPPQPPRAVNTAHPEESAHSNSTATATCDSRELPWQSHTVSTACARRSSCPHITFSATISTESDAAKEGPEPNASDEAQFEQAAADTDTKDGAPSCAPAAVSARDEYVSLSAPHDDSAKDRGPPLTNRTESGRPEPYSADVQDSASAQSTSGQREQGRSALSPGPSGWQSEDMTPHEKLLEKVEKNDRDLRHDLSMSLLTVNTEIQKVQNRLNEIERLQNEFREARHEICEQCECKHDPTQTGAQRPSRPSQREIEMQAAIDQLRQKCQKMDDLIHRQSQQLTTLASTTQGQLPRQLPTAATPGRQAPSVPYPPPHLPPPPPTTAPSSHRPPPAPPPVPAFMFHPRARTRKRKPRSAAVLGRRQKNSNTGGAQAFQQAALMGAMRGNQTAHAIGQGNSAQTTQSASSFIHTALRANIAQTPGLTHLPVGLPPARVVKTPNGVPVTLQSPEKMDWVPTTAVAHFASLSTTPPTQVSTGAIFSKRQSNVSSAGAAKRRKVRQQRKSTTNLTLQAPPAPSHHVRQLPQSMEWMPTTTEQTHASPADKAAATRPKGPPPTAANQPQHGLPLSFHQATSTQRLPPQTENLQQQTQHRQHSSFPPPPPPPPQPRPPPPTLRPPPPRQQQPPLRPPPPPRPTPSAGSTCSQHTKVVAEKTRQRRRRPKRKTPPPPPPPPKRPSKHVHHVQADKPEPNGSGGKCAPPPPLTQPRVEPTPSASFSGRKRKSTCSDFLSLRKKENATPKKKVRTKSPHRLPQRTSGRRRKAPTRFQPNDFRAETALAGRGIKRSAPPNMLPDRCHSPAPKKARQAETDN